MKLANRGRSKQLLSLELSILGWRIACLKCVQSPSLCRVGWDELFRWDGLSSLCKSGQPSRCFTLESFNLISAAVLVLLSLAFPQYSRRKWCTKRDVFYGKLAIFFKHNLWSTVSSWFGCKASQRHWEPDFTSSISDVTSVDKTKWGFEVRFDTLASLPMFQQPSMNINRNFPWHNLTNTGLKPTAKSAMSKHRDINSEVIQALDTVWIIIFLHSSILLNVLF